MEGSGLHEHSLESYITGTGYKGYFHLAVDAHGRWYWGKAESQEADPLTAQYDGPCASRGAAIDAAEAWVSEQRP